MYSLLFLLSLINFVLVFISALLLLKFVFKVTALNLWTLAGILIVGSLFLVFFGDTYRWLGIIVYIVLVGIAFYKKFKLTVPQVISLLVVVALIPLITTYLTRGMIFKSTIQPNLMKDSTSINNKITDNWGLYTSTNDGFKILFLGSPEMVKMSTQFTDKNGRKYYSTSYHTNFMTNPLYKVWVDEYSIQDIDASISGFDVYSALNEHLHNGSAVYTSIENNKFKDLPAVKFSFHLPGSLADSEKTEGIEFIYKNKFYLVEVSNKINNWLQIDADKFINSFELVSQ